MGRVQSCELMASSPCCNFAYLANFAILLTCSLRRHPYLRVSHSFF